MNHKSQVFLIILMCFVRLNVDLQEIETQINHHQSSLDVERDDQMMEHVSQSWKTSPHTVSLVSRSLSFGAIKAFITLCLHYGDNVTKFITNKRNNTDSV